jgi:diaminopimelate decarboxylase
VPGQSALDSFHRADATTATVLKSAAAAGLIGANQPLCGLLNLGGIAQSVSELLSAFVDAVDITHAFAAKANSLVPVLRLLRSLGLACEVSSPGELACARGAGYVGDEIIYDGPAKTIRDLGEAVDLAVALNADNFQELEQLDVFLAGRTPSDRYGLRVNPRVGGGSILAMSTATSISKFGVPVRSRHERRNVVAAFRRYPWLTRLHVHVGSQGCPLPLIAEGIASVRTLADEVNEALGEARISTLDIGGGLPVNFSSAEVFPTFGDYVGQLRTSVPSLFDGKYALITEFGRALTAKHGLLVATVQYTKQAAGRQIALTWAGGQVATRTVMMPEHWPLRVTIHDNLGNLKDQTPRGPLVLAGPLCFAGDVIARDRHLPSPAPGDLAVFYDTGAYYMHHHWAYNGFPYPPVYGYVIEPDGVPTFTLLRRGQTPGQIALDNGADLPTPEAIYSWRLRQPGEDAATRSSGAAKRRRD